VTIALIGIIAVAFAVRAAEYLRAPHPISGAGLSAEQAEMARNLVDHGKWFAVNPAAFELLKKRQAHAHRLVDPASVDFTNVDRTTRAEPAVDQMPGVAAVLAAFWSVTGDEVYAPLQWLQLLLDTAMVLLVYWIALRLTRTTRVALLAAALYAIWPGAIIVAKRPMLDTWAAFFTIAIVAGWLWARDKPKDIGRLVAVGALTGLGIYFRPFVVFIPIVLALVATPGGGWRRRATWAAIPTSVALVVLAPWTIRNYQEFHRFIPTRTGLGQAVFEGSGRSASDEASAQFVQRHKHGAKYGSPAYDDFLLSGAVHAIVNDPSEYLGRVGRRARLLLPCLLALLVWRRWRRASLVPVAAAVATIVPYLLIGDDTRFYLPAAFAYLILIAMSIEVTILFFGERVGRPSRNGLAIQGEARVERERVEARR
jgi:4-amino-4-deoxy-L-arabinose transferase-like glycosyltransferase